MFLLRAVIAVPAVVTQRTADSKDDWDKSEDEKPKASATTAAAPKKKMTLKQKLAEKERLAEEKVSCSQNRLLWSCELRGPWLTTATQRRRRGRSHPFDDGAGPTTNDQGKGA